MADVVCGYTDNRDEVLVAYLYDDIDPIARASFDAHLAVCERCRAELADLGGVRQRLASWSPPVYGAASRTPPVANPETPASGRQSWWHEIPAWAQVAAALLFLGVSAGIANLDIRYDKDGLTVRTGWSTNAAAVADARLKSGATPAGPAGVAGRGVGPTGVSLTAGQDVGPAGSAPWHADLAALERQLRSELRAGDVSTGLSAAHTTPIASGMSDAELLRRMRVMIDESTKQQQTELALRVANVITDVNGQRRYDLVRINTSLALLDRKYATLHEDTKALTDMVLASSQTR